MFYCQYCNEPFYDRSELTKHESVCNYHNRKEVNIK